MLNNFQPADLVRRLKELRQPRLGPDGMPVDQPWYKTPVPLVAVAGVSTLVIGGLIAGPKVVEAVGPAKEPEVVAAQAAPGPPPSPIEGTVEAPAPGDVDVSDLVRDRDGRPAPPAPGGLRQIGSPIGNRPAPAPAPEPEPKASAPAPREQSPAPREEPTPKAPAPTSLPKPTGTWNLTRETPVQPPVEAEPAPPVDTRPEPSPEPPADPKPTEPSPEPPADPKPTEPSPEPPADPKPTEPSPEPPADPKPTEPSPDPEPSTEVPEPSPVKPSTSTPKPSPSTPDSTKPTTETPTKPTAEIPKDGPVTYKVDGEGKAKVTYIGVGGNPVTEMVTLPWSKTIHKGVDPAKAKVTAHDDDGKEIDSKVEFKTTAATPNGPEPKEGREWVPAKSTTANPKEEPAPTRTTAGKETEKAKEASTTADSYGTS